MKTTITQQNFVDAFADANRSENFSREARAMLFDYLVESEQDSGVEIELDVIAICCEFEENDAKYIRSGWGLSEGDDIEEFLSEKTALVGQTTEGNYVYATF